MHMDRPRAAMSIRITQLDGLNLAVLHGIACQLIAGSGLPIEGDPGTSFHTRLRRRRGAVLLPVPRAVDLFRLYIIARLPGLERRT